MFFKMFFFMKTCTLRKQLVKQNLFSCTKKQLHRPLEQLICDLGLHGKALFLIERCSAIILVKLSEGFGEQNAWFRRTIPVS